MDSSDEEVIIVLAIARNGLDNKPRKKRKRKLWVKPWLLQRRSKLGVFNTLLQEMKLEDQEGYKNYLRMAERLIIVKDDIEKQNTRMRDVQMLNWQQPYASCQPGHPIQIYNVPFVFIKAHFQSLFQKSARHYTRTSKLNI